MAASLVPRLRQRSVLLLADQDTRRFVEAVIDHGMERHCLPPIKIEYVIDPMKDSSVVHRADVSLRPFARRPRTGIPRDHILPLAIDPELEVAMRLVEHHAGVHGDSLKMARPHPAGERFAGSRDDLVEFVSNRSGSGWSHGSPVLTVERRGRRFCEGVEARDGSCAGLEVHAMQFGRAILGALLGAVVGTAMLMAIYLTTGHDWVWLVIPFAIVTGLGVRLVDSTFGQVSYARGALTALVAIAGYTGAWACANQVMTVKAHAPRPVVVTETTSAADEAAEREREADAPRQERDAPAIQREPTSGDVVPPTESASPPGDAESAEAPALPRLASRDQEPPSTPTPWRLTTTTQPIYRPFDIACMAVAAFIAYQLGRGTAAPATPPATA
jgi:hypothetical protein